MTTLEDLKLAIDQYANEPIANQPKQRFRADAWREYAKFLLSFCSTTGDDYQEFKEAAKLVRERLK